MQILRSTRNLYFVSIVCRKKIPCQPRSHAIFSQLAFICALKKHITWIALVPVLSPVFLHEYSTIVHMSVSFERQTMSLRASALEGILSFIVISLLTGLYMLLPGIHSCIDLTAGYITYRDWRGDFHWVKLAASNPSEGQTLLALYKLLWRDRDGRRNL
jgi:hypothetical protein